MPQGLSMVSTGVVPVGGTPGHWLDPLTAALLAALAINFVYYAALAYGGLAAASALQRKRQIQ